MDKLIVRVQRAVEAGCQTSDVIAAHLCVDRRSVIGLLALLARDRCIRRETQRRPRGRPVYTYHPITHSLSDL